MRETDVAEEDLTERLKVLVARVLGVDGRAPAIDGDTDLVDDLGLDSIQMIKFLLGVEDELDLELEFDALTLDNVRTVRLLAAFILRQTAHAGR